MKQKDDIAKLEEQLKEANNKIEFLSEELEKFKYDFDISNEKSIDNFDIEWGHLYNAISNPIAILDKNQKIISMNRALKGILNKPDDEIINMYCWELFHSTSDSEPPKGCPFVKMQENGTNSTIEMIMEAFGGSYIVTCTPIFNSDGEIEKVIHIATDITERKKHENLLAEREEHLRILTNNIQDSIWEMSPEFVFTFVSGKTKDLTGYESEELIGKSLFGFLEKNSLKSLLDSIEQLKQVPIQERLDKIMRFELQFIRKDGSLIWCEVMPSYNIDSEGNLIGLRGVTRNISERKESEMKIIESERRLYEIIDFLPDPTFAIDLSGKVIAWNRAMEEITKVPKDQIIDTDKYSEAFYGEKRKMLIDFIAYPDEDIIHLYDTFKSLNGTVVGEVELTNFNGQPHIHLWGKASPLKDEDGNIIGAIESIRDITDIRHTEHALSLNKQKLDELNRMLRLVLDSAPLRIFWKDENLVFRGCNKLFAKDFGFDSPDQLIGLTDYDICPKEMADEYRKLDLQLLQSGEPILNIEEPPTRAVSQNNWLRTSRVPLISLDDNTPVGILVIHEDITEIKNATEEIRKATERLRLVFDVTNDGIWDWNLITKDIYFSERYYTMLGFEPYEFPPSFDIWQSLLHPDDKDITTSVIERHIYELSSDFNIEFRLKMKNGSYKWINGRGKVVEKDSSGKSIRMVGTHVDISGRKSDEEQIKLLNQELILLNTKLEERVIQRTAELSDAMIQLEEFNEELKLMNDQSTTDAHRIMKLNEELSISENQLKDALAAKDKFFSLIAHELKTPFSGFLLLSDMMAKDFDEISVKEMKKMSETINNSATALYSLLESLLQWSRLQLGEVPFSPEKLDLNDIANNILYLFNNKAKDKSIEIVNQIPAKTIVSCDRNMITSVFRNLVSNSVKFTDEDGYIELGIKQIGSDSVELFVKDTGIGIPADVIGELFKIDSHISTKGTKLEIGSGLGLTITKEFIDKHHGTILIDSIVGKGTIVFITLPINQQSAAN